MKDAVLVGVLECPGDLTRERQRFRGRDGPRRHALGERRAFQQLHHQGAPAGALLLTIEDSDVRVLEGREQLRLALEPRQSLGVAREGLADQLQGDVAPEANVAGAPDLTHPARTERGHDLERPEEGSGCETHGRLRVPPPRLRPPP